MRLFTIILTSLTLVTTATSTQADTLADIRQELVMLNAEMLRLKNELNTSGNAALQLGGGSQLDRINAIEAELSRLTNETEQIGFRIDRITANANNQIGDLNFRLCELEESCDVSALPSLTPLSNNTAAQPTPVQQSASATTPQLADAERADFARASNAFKAGEYQSAAAQLASFNATYPASPVAVDVELLRGQSLDQLGDNREAARAYLAAFQLNQTGSKADEALFRLGRALGVLGQTREACLTLAEVPTRFPSSNFTTEARSEGNRLNCS